MRLDFFATASIRHCQRARIRRFWHPVINGRPRKEEALHLRVKNELQGADIDTRVKLRPGFRGNMYTQLKS